MQIALILANKNIIKNDIYIIMIIYLTTSAGVGPCNPNPCQNGGQCTGEGQTYRCECLSGFAGDRCEDGNY